MNLIKELLFPRRCPVCDEVVKIGKMICRGCEKKLLTIKGPVCYICGKPLGSENEELCFDCKTRKHYFKQGLALYEYASVNQSLYRFKYNSRCEYADYYGLQMGKVLGEKIKKWNVDAIIPVPLHKSKQNQRGYNQAALLAKSFAKAVNIPYVDNLIRRQINTIPMKELDARTRQTNLKKAFIINGFDVKLNGVVVVDDIYTTGSTIDAIAKVLRQSGVKDIYFVTLAIGNGL